MHKKTWDGTKRIYIVFFFFSGGTPMSMWMQIEPIEHDFHIRYNYFISNVISYHLFRLFHLIQTLIMTNTSVLFQSCANTFDDECDYIDGIVRRSFVLHVHRTPKMLLFKLFTLLFIFRGIMLIELNIHTYIFFVWLCIPFGKTRPN